MPAESQAAPAVVGLRCCSPGDVKMKESNSSIDIVIAQSAAIRRLMSIVRAKSTGQSEFVRYSNRVMRLLVEEALTLLPTEEASIETACGTYVGVKHPIAERELCAVKIVSIVRSGNTMLEGVREVIPDIGVGHVLVQRDESDPEKRPKFFYKKFPKDVASRWILLCDPMLATGGSAKAAIKCLLEEGVPEARIIFVNLICAPEGVAAVKKEYPTLQIITAEIDEKLNDAKFIVPGLGDFGDRYYDTEGAE